MSVWCLVSVITSGSPPASAWSTNTGLAKRTGAAAAGAAMAIASAAASAVTAAALDPVRPLPVKHPALLRLSRGWGPAHGSPYVRVLLFLWQSDEEGARVVPPPYLDEPSAAPLRRRGRVGDRGDGPGDRRGRRRPQTSAEAPRRGGSRRAHRTGAAGRHGTHQVHQPPR